VDVIRTSPETRTTVTVVDEESVHERSDRLASEEPMEVRLKVAGQTRTVAITMRTPGNDFELAAGFLYCEGIVSNSAEVASIAYCTDDEVSTKGNAPDAEGVGPTALGGAVDRYNIVTVELASGTVPDLRGLERYFYTSSACGVCGKASLDALAMRGVVGIPPGFRIAPAVVHSLPEVLRASQGVFDSTGGLHAAGLFGAEGDLDAVKEDVGRHNAVDKLIGWALLADRLPLHERVLLVSGRASYEIMQKAAVAGVPVVCAVSAPSSLAVDVANRFGMTLVGFVRGRRFNIYSRPDRVGR
jgi:FdhD protein